MLLRVLDEVEFWKRQETEHTDVIRTFAPDLEAEFVEMLKQWKQAFADSEALAIRYIETLVRSGDHIPLAVSQVISSLVEHSLQQSQHFIDLLVRMETESQALKNPFFGVVLEHIRRESEYFIGVAQVVLYTNHA